VGGIGVEAGAFADGGSWMEGVETLVHSQPENFRSLGKVQLVVVAVVVCCAFDVLEDTIGRVSSFLQVPIQEAAHRSKYFDLKLQQQPVPPWSNARQPITDPIHHYLRDGDVWESRQFVQWS
jgi:hypothetical protein